MAKKERKREKNEQMNVNRTEGREEKDRAAEETYWRTVTRVICESSLWKQKKRKGR
jgi:hypothetical protein